MGFFKKFYDVFTDTANIFSSGRVGVTAEKVIIDKKTPVTIVNYNTDYIKEITRRNQELLEHNNLQLGIIRAQKAELKDQRVIIGELDSLLVKHSEHTGYCGCDLEKRAVMAGEVIVDG